MLRKLSSVLVLIASLGLTLPLLGCPAREKSLSEKAEDAADSVGDAASDAADAVGDAADDAGDAVKDAVD
jgi:hypothetical protein